MHRITRIRQKTLLAILLVIAMALFSYLSLAPVHDLPRPGLPAGRRTVAMVVEHLQPKLHAKVQDLYTRAGLAFPPAQLTLLAIKDAQRLEVWARDAGDWRHVVSYPFTAFSGTLGPKLREGDGQIPEGLYRIDLLNPNSQYHLSMRVSYPNEFDRRMAQREGRTRLGGDIFIHGKAVSIGCIAIGDEPIEELFYMVARTGASKTDVIIAPCDFRAAPSALPSAGPLWLADLYATIRERMSLYKPAAQISDPHASR